MADAGATSDLHLTERLPFTEYIARLTEMVGATTSTGAGKAIWEHGPYRVTMTDRGEGLFDVQYLTNGVQEDHIMSATVIPALEDKAKDICEFLDGPPAPLPPPKKRPVDEQRIEAIQRQLRRVQQQVSHMMDNRRWNLVYQDIVARNPTLQQPNAMLAHFQRVYTDYAVLAVRRQAKDKDESVSLRGVMVAVKENADMMTREWYHRLWRGETKSRFAPGGVGGPFVTRNADEIFSSFANATRESVDPDVVEDDLSRFDDATYAIVRYADKIIAHDDKAGLGQKVAGYSWDLDGAVKTVSEFTCRYGQLLLAIVPIDMTPMGFINSVRVFRQPWIGSENDVDLIGSKVGLRD